MLRIGLQMRPVSSARVRETGRCVSEAGLEADRMSLSRWRPDFVAVSFKAKTIAIPELCRPSDTLPGQLQAAYERKINLYDPLVALGRYSDSGWSVKLLPWLLVQGNWSWSWLCTMNQSIQRYQWHSGAQ